jgi:hypothetical protein
MTLLPELRRANLEITIPEEVSLRLKPRQIDASEPDTDDEASITSEISLDFVARELNNEKVIGSQGSSNFWDPDGSDFTLDDLLNGRGDEEKSANDSTKDSLMTSDYSLNIRLSRSQHSLTTSMSSNLGISQHSADSFATFATNWSVEQDPPRDEEEEHAGSHEGKRTVSFDPQMHFHRVPNRASMLRTTKSLVWYSREDFKTIRQDCFDTIRLMQRGNMIDEDQGMCALGLEYKTTEMYKARQRNKKQVRQVVLDEQEFQRDNGVIQPEWIARVSREQSQECIDSATKAARLIEQNIKPYLADDTMG